MKVGIIGCGNIAQVHGWVLNQLEMCELAAVCDCKIEKAKQLSSEYTEENAKVYEDYLKMLDYEELDVVHICTPHYLHVPMAIEALKRNISVFMEKPPAITKEEFEALIQVEAGSLGRISFCFQNRYNATTGELDRIVASKSLGAVKGVRGFVTWKRDENYYSDGWHGKLAMEGGGALINQSIHTLDLMLRYLGTPKKVAASMQNHHLQGITEVEDTIEAWMEFEGGKRASFYATTAYATDAPVILEISFDKGRVTMIDRILQVQENGGEVKNILCEETKDSVGKSYWGKGHLTCIQDFYKCLEENIPNPNDLAGVSNTLYTTMQIYEDAGRR